MKQKGFTFIEIIIAIGIMSVLGAIIFAGFNNYRQVQTLQTSSDEVATMLNLAKSRAQSQIKPSACAGDLNGYRVVIAAPKSYELRVSCVGSGETAISEQSKQLPANVTFSNSSSFFFLVRTGKTIPDSGETIAVNYAGKTKTITINALGGVNIQ
jgi:prepilin-type N-terminal cleavage/methylation domain-containing protein